MTTTITVSTITSKQFEMEVGEGLTFILNHLDNLWPRMISTYRTGGAQIQVKNSAEAMAWFKAANFLDCRISAYPKYTDYYIHRTGIAPTVLMVDIDKEHFKSIEEFELAVTKTYTNFHNILGSRPTQLWTGGGCHFIQPQSVPVLENINDFQKFDQSSRKFLQWEEQLLTDNKADESHWSTVSFNNMMLRVPFTLNSSGIKERDTEIPYDARVRIEKHWEGNIPIIGKLMLMRCYNWLQFKAISDIREQRVREQNRKCYGRTIDIIYLHNYGYIDRLYDKPIDDYRGFCIWRIFVPYFINIKRLSTLETSDKIRDWLGRCNTLKPLSFRPESKIKYAINHVGTYYPPQRDNLEQINKPFYELLKTEGIIDNEVTN